MAKCSARNHSPLSGGASILATLLRGGTERQDRRMRHPSAARTYPLSERRIASRCAAPSAACAQLVEYVPPAGTNHANRRRRLGGFFAADRAVRVRRNKRKDAGDCGIVSSSRNAPSRGTKRPGTRPLSARCCHGASPSGPVWNARKTRHDSIAPSAAKWCSDGRKVPTATGHLFPMKMPALDLSPLSARCSGKGTTSLGGVCMHRAAIAAGGHGKRQPGLRSGTGSPGLILQAYP